MGGVDKNDQLRGYYSKRIKGVKSYKYIWWFIIDVAITNAFILSKHYSDIPAKSVKELRTKLAKKEISTTERGVDVHQQLFNHQQHGSALNISPCEL